MQKRLYDPSIAMAEIGKEKAEKEWLVYFYKKNDVDPVVQHQTLEV